MVSIIVPTYNSAKYIRQSLDSVLNQTFKDYEIIVVDDGSTDDTKEILDCYPMVRYMFQQRSGAAMARNTGIKEAKGELIAFLDADDIWLPTKLEKQVEHFRQHAGLSFVFTENSLFDANGIIKHNFNKKHRLLSGDIVRNIFRYSNVVTPTVMVRREIFEKVGLFEEDLVTGEDDNMWLRIAMKFKMDLIDEPLVLCRRNETSLTTTPNNIFLGVKKHLDLIESKYPDLKRKLGSHIKKKHSELHLERGIGYFGHNEFEMARQQFEESLKYWNLNQWSLLYWVCSFLPLGVIKILRNVKRKVSHSFVTPYWPT